MDQNWINFIFFAATVLVAIIIYLLQKNTKKLSYEIILDTSLVTVNSKITVKEKIKIYFEDNIVTNPNFISLRFTNDGNQPISKLDFEEDIVLKFANDSQIIQCDSPKMYPENLGLEFNYDNNSVTIKPLLLNSGEFFDLHIIIDNNSSFEIIDRVKGLRIKKYKEPFFISSSVFNFFLLMVVMCIFTYYIAVLNPSTSPEDTLKRLENLPFYILPILPLVFLIMHIPDMYRYYRKSKFNK